MTPRSGPAGPTSATLLPLNSVLKLESGAVAMSRSLMMLPRRVIHSPGSQGESLRTRVADRQLDADRRGDDLGAGAVDGADAEPVAAVWAEGREQRVRGIGGGHRSPGPAREASFELRADDRPEVIAGSPIDADVCPHVAAVERSCAHDRDLRYLARGDLEATHGRGILEVDDGRLADRDPRLLRDDAFARCVWPAGSAGLGRRLPEQRVHAAAHVVRQVPALGGRGEREPEDGEARDEDRSPQDA